jgi:hypothetical protein
MPHIAGQEEPFPDPDNQSKMKRSCENAEHVGKLVVIAESVDCYVGKQMLTHAKACLLLMPGSTFGTSKDDDVHNMTEGQDWLLWRSTTTKLRSNSITSLVHNCSEYRANSSTYDREIGRARI